MCYGLVFLASHTGLRALAPLDDDVESPVGTAAVWPASPPVYNCANAFLDSNQLPTRSAHGHISWGAKRVVSLAHELDELSPTRYRLQHPATMPIAGHCRAPSAPPVFVDRQTQRRRSEGNSGKDKLLFSPSLHRLLSSAGVFWSAG